MKGPEKHLCDRDMSEEGINRRMRKLSELYQFWRSVNLSRRAEPQRTVHEAPETYRTEDRP